MTNMKTEWEEKTKKKKEQKGTTTQNKDGLDRQIDRFICRKEELPPLTILSLAIRDRK